ncbi:MAG: hypothetical protein ACLT98_07505 [Eggerthellaceae bacterium]
MGIWDNVSSMLGKGADAAGAFRKCHESEVQLAMSSAKARPCGRIGESLYETVAAILAGGRPRADSRRHGSATPR